MARQSPRNKLHAIAGPTLARSWQLTVFSLRQIMIYGWSNVGPMSAVGNEKNEKKSFSLKCTLVSWVWSVSSFQVEHNCMDYHYCNRHISIQVGELLFAPKIKVVRNFFVVSWRSVMEGEQAAEEDAWSQRHSLGKTLKKRQVSYTTLYSLLSSITWSTAGVIIDRLRMIFGVWSRPMSAFQLAKNGGQCSQAQRGLQKLWCVMITFCIFFFCMYLFRGKL